MAPIEVSIAPYPDAHLEADRAMQTTLVVDDAPETLRQRSELLAPYAHVLVARSGAKALEIARTTSVDLILLDV